MGGDKQCWTCVFGMNRSGEVSCDNGYVNRLRKNKPDPYDCEFYEEVSDDYAADIEKLSNAWDGR